MTSLFPLESRTTAGRALAEALLLRFADKRNLIVLAFPRGGVPVAAEVARALRADLDLIIVRKLGAPQQRRPVEIVAAVPVAPEETIARLRARVEQVVCLATPEPFFSIGQWYRDFGETSDDEVHTLLREAWGGGESE